MIDIARRIVNCPYCGRMAAYVDSKVVYGRSYGMIYLCRPCDAYVGVHDGTDAPLGRLANKELRYWKKAAHAAFDPLWRSGRMRRSAAYRWLAESMNLTPQETHIGMFDVHECQLVIELSNQELRGDFHHGEQKRGYR